jgi:hypothetical protein
MKFTEISFSNIKAEIERFLKTEHNKANALYSPASPFGQILSIIENLHQLSLLYLKNSIKGLDLTIPDSNNPRVIKNAAIVAGHNPGRALSATGNLKLTVKAGIDLSTELPGGRVTFLNKSLMRNNTNGLDYSLNLGVDKTTYNVNPTTQIYLPIIQGKFSKRTLTGTGNINQTFSIALKGRDQIENFNIEVLVNGEYWTVKKHLYEISPNEKACVVKTGFNEGIDLIFGNGGFGSIPPLGSNIEVNFLITNGLDGNIFRRTVNDFKFSDEPIDGFGNTFDITKVFDIQIYNDINFGANAESVLFTKNLLPVSSNNFVLGLPQQYAYEIKKLGVFSHVNAYESDNRIFIVATPNIKLFKNKNADYFSVDVNAFTLDNYEKSKIDKYLRSNGNIQLTRKYTITSPDLSYYVMNIFVIKYSDATDESVNSEIIDKVSEYFLNFNRMDRIPKSDLIKELSSIQSIHSVDIQFISKKNEDYHKQAQTLSVNKSAGDASKVNPNLSQVDPNYNPNSTLGLDPTMGDILFEPNEIPIIRGGWYDRNAVYFSPNMEDNGLKSINIIKKGSVDPKNKNNG